MTTKSPAELIRTITVASADDAIRLGEKISNVTGRLVTLDGAIVSIVGKDGLSRARLNRIAYFAGISSMRMRP